MDVFKLLKRDHREVKGLFKTLENSKPSKAREKNFQTLYQELSLHAEVEETIFYPRVREEEKLREMVGEAYEEHHVAKYLLEELAQLSMEDERWDSKLTVLKEMIEHHVEEEEGELFPKAAKVLGKEDAKALGQQIEAAKEQGLKAMKKAKRESKSASSGNTHAEQAAQA